MPGYAPGVPRTSPGPGPSAALVPDRGRFKRMLEHDGDDAASQPERKRRCLGRPRGADAVGREVEGGERSAVDAGG